MTNFRVFPESLIMLAIYSPMVFLLNELARLEMWLWTNLFFPA